MHRISTVAATVAFAAFTLFLAAPAAAQDAGSTVLTHDEIRGLVEDQVREDSEHRAALETFLGRSEVAEIAERAGIDIQHVRSAARVLSDAEAASLAQQLRDAEAALAGGDTVTISTTVVIIALLVIILIIVA